MIPEQQEFLNGVDVVDIMGMAEAEDEQVAGFLERVQASI